MNFFLIRLYKVQKAVLRAIREGISRKRTKLLFRLNGIRFGSGLRAIGVPSVNISIGGNVTIGKGFYLRTGVEDTEVGFVGSRIRVGPKGTLTIGNRVWASNVSIFCHQSVTIGNHVLLGGGVQIFDTNFHSTDPSVRGTRRETYETIRTAPVFIGSHAFIGTNAIVCKGVSIGENAVVAAGSVVVQDIPSGETWGGNPARKIKSAK